MANCYHRKKCVNGQSGKCVLFRRRQHKKRFSRLTVPRHHPPKRAHPQKLSVPSHRSAEQPVCSPTRPRFSKSKPNTERDATRQVQHVCYCHTSCVVPINPCAWVEAGRKQLWHSHAHFDECRRFFHRKMWPPDPPVPVRKWSSHLPFA